MASLVIAGLDPALANVGMAKGKLDTESGIFKATDLKLVSTTKSTIKNIRVNTDDLERCRKLYNSLVPFLHDVDVVMIELPVGSQTSRAMMSYGACCMLAATITKPVIVVTPTEVKLSGYGTKTATKDQMIEWAMNEYPTLPWLRAKNKNEHLADAIAAIHAGVNTDQFKIIQSVCK